MKPLPVAVEELLDDDGNLVPYHSCPMLFIPRVVWEWYERWTYLQKYPHTAPPYDEQDPRFLAFERYYLGRLNDYRARLQQVGGMS